MNSDQFKGQWKQFKGELKTKWANFTDDDLLHIEGDYDKFTGKLQERYGDKKDEVSRWADQWHAQAQSATQSDPRQPESVLSVRSVPSSVQHAGTRGPVRYARRRRCYIMHWYFLW